MYFRWCKKLRIVPLFASVALAITVSACGGGGGSTPRMVAASAQPIAARTPSIEARVQVTIVVPERRPAATTRHRSYVSASTRGLIVTVVDSSGTNSYGYDILPSSPGCSTVSGSQVSCTLTLPAASGSDTFSAYIYDAGQGASNPTTLAPNYTPAGNLLSEAAGSVQTVDADAANQLTLTLEAVVKTIDGSQGPKTVSVSGNGGTTSQNARFDGEDAAGNLIAPYVTATAAAAYYNPIAVAVSDGGKNATTPTLSALSNALVDSVGATFNGAPSTQPTSATTTPYSAKMVASDSLSNAGFGNGATFASTTTSVTVAPLFDYSSIYSTQKGIAVTLYALAAASPAGATYTIATTADVSGSNYCDNFAVAKSSKALTGSQVAAFTITASALSPTAGASEAQIGCAFAVSDGTGTTTLSTPFTAGSVVDLTCDNAAYPSTAYTQCEDTNYSMTGEADDEQTEQTAFGSQQEAQSLVNEQQLVARDTADPSWLSAQSGDTPSTPACTRWDGICVGDPFRYPDVNGPDGSTFYTSQGVVTPVVFYDSQCARISGQVWAPANSSPGQALPNIVIDGGSLEAPQTVYWWAAQALVRQGYVVLTFDPRGQGRSDEQTPTGTQGGNINITVFWTGLVDAIDFFRSTPAKPYPNNVTCANTYATTMTPYNPYWNRLDLKRLGIAGHSAGSTGVDTVQGYGGPGAAPWPGLIDKSNPVKAMVAWDGLRGPTGGDQGGIGNDANGTTTIPNYSARVPSMGQSSEYGLDPTPYLSPPPAELHKDAYNQWVTAGTPVYELTIQGSTHYDFSLTPTLAATSWCPNAASMSCEGGWANPMAIYYTLAWFDRWLKNPGDLGYADADARLLDDNGPQGRGKMSWHFHSARDYPDRNGVVHHCEIIRLGCADTGIGTNSRVRSRASHRVK